MEGFKGEIWDESYYESFYFLDIFAWYFVWVEYGNNNKFDTYIDSSIKNWQNESAAAGKS